MSGFFQDFVLCFVPLFIVIDAFGILPFVVAMGEGQPRKWRNRMVHIAVITAVVVGLIFLFFGQFILRVMDISMGSFAIAGGIVLLVFSISYMTTGHMVKASREEMVAIVPIGTPLTVGPATITTLLLLALQYPIYTVLIAFAVNMVIAWVLFLLSNQIARLLGEGGMRAVSRIFSLLLAAIAVSMIIKGLNLTGIIGAAG